MRGAARLVSTGSGLMAASATRPLRRFHLGAGTAEFAEGPLKGWNGACAGSFFLKSETREKEPPMKRKTSGLPDERTERRRRKNLSDEQVNELERAGGVEAGMQAGSAGGSDLEPKAWRDQSVGRTGQTERRAKR